MKSFVKIKSTLVGAALLVGVMVAVALLPPLVTAVLALLVGLLASYPFSPLEWAMLIPEREFYRP